MYGFVQILRNSNPPSWAKYWKPHIANKSEQRGTRFKQALISLENSCNNVKRLKI